MLQTHHRTHLGPVWFIKFYSTSLRLWVVAKQILNLIWKTTTASKTREKCKHIVFRMQFQTDACVLCVPMMHSANAFIIQQRLKYTSFLVDFRWVFDANRCTTSYVHWIFHFYDLLANDALHVIRFWHRQTFVVEFSICRKNQTRFFNWLNFTSMWLQFVCVFPNSFAGKLVQF